MRPVTGKARRVCPECKVEGYRFKLRFRGGSRTAWYGVLRFYSCRVCRSEFISVNSRTPEQTV